MSLRDERVIGSGMDFVSAVYVELSENATVRIKNYLLRYAMVISEGRLKTLAGGVLQTEL